MEFVIIGAAVLFFVLLIAKFSSKRKLDLSVLPSVFVVLDLETTGLDPDKHEIIEVGAIRVERDSENHATFEALVRPRTKITKRIAEITGITQVMVDEDGNELGETLREFKKFIGDHPLVSFNAKFDMAFLHNAAKTHNLEINNRTSCALEMARRAWPGRESYKQADLAKVGNLSSEGTHRALGDCRRTVIIYSAAAEILKSAS